MALARPGVMPSAPPAPAPKPRKPKTPKKTPEQVLEEERQRSKRQFITWTSVAVVAAVLAGVIGWWMAAGRYADVPELVGKQESELSALMGDASLKFVTAMEASDTVPKGEVLRTEPAAGTELMRGDLVRITVSLGRPVVPQLKSNLDVAVAQQELKLVGLEGEVNEAENAYSATVPVGKVVTLKPEPGTQVPIGTKITIVLSKGPEPKPVPDVVGKSKADAFAELTAAGFEPVEGKAEFAQGVEEGKVIRITPAAGTNVPEGDKKVTVVVSGGAVTVPEVKGKRVKDARKDLEKLGLEVEVQFNGSDRARVFSQSPDAGTKVEKGSRVTLVGI
nr:PASTA domain-containing protein [Actinosynnema pretiosum]